MKFFICIKDFQCHSRKGVMLYISVVDGDHSKNNSHFSFRSISFEYFNIYL